jgi:hypothetical protein
MNSDNRGTAKQAKQLKNAAWQLADEWHDRKRDSVTVADLEAICPGHTPAEYQKAIDDALLWASK